jgi:lysozyme
MSTLSNWTAKLKARRKLLAEAKRSVAWWSKRATNPHGKAMLAEARARLALRKQQVSDAQRVVNRHKGVNTVSNRGLALIAGFEGFRAKPYRDGVGVLTIGYGETQGVHAGMVWTRKHALDRLRTRVNRDYLEPVLVLANHIGLHLQQNEADALASLVYNLGPGILDQGRTMGDALRSKNRRRIADAFLVYDNPNDPAVHAGLARRRRTERALFLR